MPNASRQTNSMSIDQTACGSAAFVLVALLVVGMTGCAGESENPPRHTKPPVESRNSQTAFSEAHDEDEVPSLDPELLVEIQGRHDANPQRPLPSDAGAAAGNTFNDLLAEWFRQRMIKAYQTVGKRDSRWDTEAKTILEMELELNIRPAKLTGSEIPELNPACDDPVVCSSYATLLQQASRLPEAEHWQRRAMNAFEGSKYCQGVARRATMRVADFLKGRGQEKERRQLLDRATKQTIAAANDGSFANGHQRVLLVFLETGIEGGLKDREEELLTALRTGPDVDPWIGAMLRARYHTDKGWQARGGGYANMVTEDGWKEFRRHLQLASAELVHAWQLHPEFPEAATKLIAITMANGGVAGETPRFWFDEAVRAEFGYRPAYDALLWAYRPRWGGSHELMEGFGLECLATERFDTDVPWMYLRAICGIGEDLDDKRMAYVRPGVFERCQKLFERYIEVTTERSRIDNLKTEYACVAWLSGEPAKTEELLDELGDRVQAEAFTVHEQRLAEVRKDLKHPSGWAARARRMGQTVRFQVSNDECWKVVSVPGRSRGEYESALRTARSVCENVPDDGWFLNTLGVAEYRVGNYAEAVATLARSRHLNRESHKSDVPGDLAFLAMGYYRLGRSDEGLRCLTDLRESMKQPRWAGNAEAVRFLSEAEGERLKAEVGKAQQSAGAAASTERREQPQSTPNRAPEAPPSNSDYVVQFSGRQFVEIANTTGALDVNGDFTIEIWIRWPRRPDENLQSIATDEAWQYLDDVDRTHGWVLRTRPAGSRYVLDFTVAGEVTPWLNTFSSPIQHTGEWHHIAVCKSAREIRIHLDGKTVGARRFSETFVPSPIPLCLGPPHLAPADRRLDGQVQSFRISSIARYTGDFTPPTSFERDGNTVVLLGFSHGHAEDLSGNGRHGKFFGPTWATSDKLSVRVAVTADEEPVGPTNSSDIETP